MVTVNHQTTILLTEASTSISYLIPNTKLQCFYRSIKPKAIRSISSTSNGPPSSIHPATTIPQLNNLHLHTDRLRFTSHLPQSTENS